MKILVFSDSHGRCAYMEKAIVLHKPDRMIHLGDCMRDVEKIRDIFPELPIISLPGNCDYDSVTPPVRVINLCGHKIFATHGHLHNVKYGLQRLYYAALEAGCELAVFGHSHRAYCEKEGELLLLNPGCGAEQSYAILEMDENKKLTCSLSNCP